jgi:hypothetical protein
MRIIRGRGAARVLSSGGLGIAFRADPGTLSAAVLVMMRSGPEAHGPARFVIVPLGGGPDPGLFGTGAKAYGEDCDCYEFARGFSPWAI